MLQAGAPRAQGCPHENEERDFWGTLPKGLLTTVMMALGDQKTGAFGSARTQGLARFLSLTYVIVANILVLNGEFLCFPQCSGLLYSGQPVWLTLHF